MADQTTIEDMRWPGLKAKFWPVTVIRVPLSRPWFSVDFRNWYYGRWCIVNLGPWIILIGAGTYD